jgi:hypothetical protein
MNAGFGTRLYRPLLCARALSHGPFSSLENHQSFYRIAWGSSASGYGIRAKIGQMSAAEPLSSLAASSCGGTHQLTFSIGAYVTIPIS